MKFAADKVDALLTPLLGVAEADIPEYLDIDIKVSLSLILLIYFQTRGGVVNYDNLIYHSLAYLILPVLNKAGF